MAAKTYEMANCELADTGTRFVAWLIDGAILFVIESVDFFSALVDETRQGWQDKLARTYVVKAE